MNPVLPITVVKIGGSLLSGAEKLNDLWSGLRELCSSASVVLVHGGGPQATEMARRLGHEPRIVQGRRVTTDTDLDIMHWTVRGAMNTRLVAAAIEQSIPAVGISGVDGSTVVVEKRPPWDMDGQTVDFGWVGDVRLVETRLLRSLLASGFLPIVAPLGIDAAGQTYNVNADTVACALAGALNATRFLLVTETGGVRQEWDDPASRLETCSAETFASGRAQGWIRDGMLVKLRVAFDALSKGVPDVHILAPDDVVSRSRGTRVINQ